MCENTTDTNLDSTTVGMTEGHYTLGHGCCGHCRCHQVPCCPPQPWPYWYRPFPGYPEVYPQVWMSAGITHHSG